jgi:hypothetical protein
VTAAVYEADHAAYVQAVNSSTGEQSVDKCLAVFSTADVLASQRVSALSGGRSDWSDAIVSELSEVSSVQFFADPLGLEDAVNAALAEPLGSR